MANLSSVPLQACASTTLLSRAPVALGIAVLRGVSRKVGTALVEKAKADAASVISRDETLILNRIRRYSHYFSSCGYECPLTTQFERAKTNGVGRLNRFVDTLLVVEMTTGILMGCQDYGRMVGTLNFDLVSGTETYDGMRTTIHCKEGEIVVRDDVGIVASYFQGSDSRTAISRQTADVVFFGFGVAETPASDVETALKQAVEILAPASESSSLLMVVR